MARVSETMNLVDGIVRLRRAERVPEVAEEIAPVRRALEWQVGPTLSRSRAARILGTSQTALDRWVESGQVPLVVTPSGRKEIPRQVVIELREAVDRLREQGITRHPLAGALAQRHAAGRDAVLPAERTLGSRDHVTAERRGLAYHRAIAERLDRRLVADARDQVDRLEADGHLAPRYASAWRDVLSRPLGEIAEAITAASQAAHDLRQNSPFAGVLNEHERRRIIEAVR